MCLIKCHDILRGSRSRSARGRAHHGAACATNCCWCHHEARCTKLEGCDRHAPALAHREVTASRLLSLTAGSQYVRPARSPRRHSLAEAGAQAGQARTVARTRQTSLVTRRTRCGALPAGRRVPAMVRRGRAGCGAWQCPCRRWPVRVATGRVASGPARYLLRRTSEDPECQDVGARQVGSSKYYGTTERAELTVRTRLRGREFTRIRLNIYSSTVYSGGPPPS